MSLIYDFQFGPTCATLEAVVTETLTGVEVADSPVTLDSAGSAQVALDEGSYVALVAGSTRAGIRWGDLRTNGTLNQTASIEAAMLAPVAP